MIVKLFAVAFGGSISAVLQSLVYDLIESKYHSYFLWCCPSLSKPILTPTRDA